MPEPLPRHPTGNKNRLSHNYAVLTFPLNPAFLELITIVFTEFAPVKAFAPMLVIVAGSVTFVAFLAFANVFAPIFVTVYFTPSTVTLEATETLFFVVFFTAVTVAVPFEEVFTFQRLFH